MDSDNDILNDPLLSSSVENHVASSSYQENSSNESKKSYYFSNKFDTLHGFRKTISFSHKKLVSLKLFELLHESHTPMTLHKDVQEFTENTIPVLINIEKPCIVSRSDLLNQIHKDIVF